jgi:hypothetical protein
LNGTALIKQPISLRDRWLMLVGLFLVSLVFFSIPLMMTNGVWFSTDQRNFVRTAETLRSDFSVILPSAINERYDTVVFDAHQYPYVKQHRGHISQYPPGQPLVLAALGTFIPNYNLATCVTAAFGVAAFFAMVLNLGGVRAALFGAITLISTPIYVFYATPALADISSFVVLVVALTIYLGTVDSRLRRYFLVALLLGFSVWLKYVNIVFVLAFVVHYLIYRRRAHAWRPVLVVAVTMLCSVGLLLLYHKWAFGGFFTTGYGYLELSGARNAADANNAEAGRSLFDSLKTPHLRYGAIRVANFSVLAAICAPVALTGIFALFAVPRRDWPQVSLLMFTCAVVLAIYLLLTGNTFGTDNYDRLTFSSFNRYILPVYCLLIVPIALVFRDAGNWRWVGALVFITGLNLASAWFAPTNLSNLSWHVDYQQHTQELRRRQLEITPEGAVIVGCALPFYMLDMGRPTIHCKETDLRWVKEVDRVVLALLRDGHEVFLSDEYRPGLTVPGLVKTQVDEQTKTFRLTLSE